MEWTFSFTDTKTKNPRNTIPFLSPMNINVSYAALDLCQFGEQYLKESTSMKGKFHNLYIQSVQFVAQFYKYPSCLQNANGEAD